jgi:lipopolysaccharide export system protein LptA
VANNGAKTTDGKGAENSSLDHAIADGNVEIVSTQPDRTRTGTSEHAEYFAGDGRVVLTEGKPQLVDSLKGTTKGRQLTWFSQDDRLLVNGVAAQPAHSVILRKKK